MQVESEITVNRPTQDVFEYIARAEYLPEYVTDFESVRQVSEGAPGAGTEYSYKMKRGAEGTFQWTAFEPTSRLAWEGPPAKAGPGTMEPAGWWELSGTGDATHIKLVMAPKPGGLFKLLAPLMAAGMRKGNAKALERLKTRLESQAASAPPAQPEMGAPPAQPEMGAPPAPPEEGMPPAQPEEGMPPTQPEEGMPPTQPEEGMPPTQPEQGATGPSEPPEV